MNNGIIIVGSGKSALGFKPDVYTPIIAVNGAIDWIERANYWFTLDPSPANLHRIHNKKKGVDYRCALPRDMMNNFITDTDLLVYERISKTYADVDKNSPDYWFKRWGCISGLSEDKSKIHTGNSAYGALGLAYHLGYTKVLLVGVDGTQCERIEGGKPNNLSHLPKLFQSAKHQIKIKTISDLQGIEKTNINEGLKWLQTN